MKEKLRIKGLGHSAFKITLSDYHVVIDPYGDHKVPGLLPLRVDAHAVYATHGHGDHHFLEAVTLLAEAPPSPWTLTRIPSAHDGVGGKLRGMNDILLFEGGGWRIAHLGDLGEMLSEEKRAMLRHLDVLMIPVGGFFTLGPQEALELVEALHPRIVVPMHYRDGDLGYAELEELDSFLKFCPEVKRYPTGEILLDGDTPDQTAVLAYVSGSA